MFKASLLLLIALLGACSNQDIYEAIQHSNKQECEKLLPSAREECLTRNQQSYDDYTEERDVLLKP